MRHLALPVGAGRERMRPEHSRGSSAPFPRRLRSISVWARLASVLVLTAAATAAPAIAATGSTGLVRPATAAADPPRYVALGDSYSSGEGNPPFDSSSNSSCHRSTTNAYAKLLHSVQSVYPLPSAFVACSQATLDNMDHSQGSAPPQLSSVIGDESLISLTIGGNDLGFSDLAYSCIDSPVSCTGKLKGIPDKIAALKPKLTSLYEEIHSKALGARIAVLGYPDIFAPNPVSYCKEVRVSPVATISKSEMAALDKAIDEFDTAIQEAVTEASAHGANATYVDPHATFAGGGLCSGTPSTEDFNGVNLTHQVYSLHPNARGQLAYAKALAAALNLPPRASFTYTRRPGAGNIVAFNGTSSSDPDGSVVRWTWTSGGTVIATGPQPVLPMGQGATKTVTLVVTDDQGATSSSTRDLSLADRRLAITGMSPATGQVVGSNTPTLSASATDDDADSLQYAHHVTGPHVDLSSGWVSGSWTVPAHQLDPGTTYQWTVTVRDPSGLVSARSSTFTVAMLPTAADVVSTSTGGGYWQVDTYGGVFTHGDARFYNSLPGLGIHVTNIMGMARTADNGGYWLVGRDGGVFAFGDAPYAGSLPGLNIHLNDIVGMAPTPTGQGYWLVGSDGGVFAFGDAPFYGSMGGKPLNAPVTAMAASPSGKGYWLAAEDGGIFAFGDAPFYGSMGGKHLNAPVVDMDATPDGRGYWMTAQDGGVFAFGDAPFYGSMAGKPLNGHITGMSATATGKGYWLNGCDGGIFSFGDAVFRGSNPTFECRGIN
jgi:hypothetical protein